MAQNKFQTLQKAKAIISGMSKIEKLIGGNVAKQFLSYFLFHLRINITENIQILKKYFLMPRNIKTRFLIFHKI